MALIMKFDEAWRIYVVSAYFRCADPHYAHVRDFGGCAVACSYLSADMRAPIVLLCTCAGTPESGYGRRVWPGAGLVHRAILCHSSDSPAGWIRDLNASRGESRYLAFRRSGVDCAVASI